jgi:hypothetical protein
MAKMPMSYLGHVYDKEGLTREEAFQCCKSIDYIIPVEQHPVKIK